MALRHLCVVLGDQLNSEISALRHFDPTQDRVMMCEVRSEATYVKHHKKKIALIFSAMRHFAQELAAQNFPIDYTFYDDPENAGSFLGEVARAVQKYKPQKIIVTFPNEYRVAEDIKGWSDHLGLPVEIRDDDRYLSSVSEFQDWSEGRKSLRMEFFYREMRKKFQILLDKKGEPEGGQWNYDSENRKKIPKNLIPPPPTQFAPDEITNDVLTLVEKNFSDHFGDLRPFHFAVTRTQALKVLDEFLSQRLPLFGDYQDAMKEGEAWLFHSHISFYLNCGLLNPLEVIRAAEERYYSGHAPLNAVEGFIRQIAGWREYIRGIYWLKMPEYKDHNHLNATRDLPWFYWSGDTKMNCLKQCVRETKENAYAHHIQRLMVLGNFALLAGLDPAQVNEWYHIVYADAYEWVELPNVSGMVLFADGGYLASKPYAASGAYINKMSDYCEKCHYKVAEKNGPDACPFNYLYWDFLDRNAAKLRGNMRLAMPYRTLEKMSAEKIAQIRQDSREFLCSDEMRKDLQ